MAGATCFRGGASPQCTPAARAMQLAPFIFSFFASKRVSLLTAFVCWQPGELQELWAEARGAGARLRVHTDFRRLPALPAYAVHREGVLLDVACPDAELVLREASSSRAFNLRHTWLVLHPGAYSRRAAEGALAAAAILPDADVTWAARDALADVYRVRADRPLVVAELGLDRNCSAGGLRARWDAMPTAVARRKDLQNVYLKADVVVSQPQHFRGWGDLRDRQIDTFPKVTYPLMMLAAEDLHFRYNMHQIHLYGEERNGSFDGLAGRLQRGDAELGVASVFLRADRWRVLHYSAETVELRGAFMFLQPAQASVSNVFALPFSRGAWACGAAVWLAAAALLALLARRLPSLDPALRPLTPAEALTYIVGTVCQQGTPLSPGLAGVRVLMLSLLLLSLFSFTAYSAKIVAILQAPSTAIRTIDQLARSRMACAVQETTYKKVYFEESRDPATQRLYRRKLAPLGDAAYLSVVEGIARVRAGHFAFQVEESSAYDVISQTFTEREKCALQQVEAFRLPMVGVPVRRHSGYRDLLAARLRWQREAGLMSRARRVWMAGRPRCGAGGAGFVSVALQEVLPAVQILLAGAALSLLVLAAERARARLSRSRAVGAQSPTTSEEIGPTTSAQSL